MPTAEQYLPTALADHQAMPLNLTRARTLRAAVRAVVNHGSRRTGAVDLGFRLTGIRLAGCPMSEIVEIAEALVAGAPVEWALSFAGAEVAA